MNPAAGNAPYEVFARRRPGEQLGHIGSVFAANPTLAVHYARWMYDEEAWAEMCVVPRAQLRPVAARRHGSTPERRV